ncbi:MAG: CbrC family protein [Armatimonadota bacterium]|nr:CbrC family protein [Armatimonadota bacterium]
MTITFRYLHDAQECWRQEEKEPCLVCRQSHTGYWFIVMHENGYDEYHVCEPCLVSGRLSERGLRVNNADIDALREQLRAKHPELPEKEREFLLNERTSEVEQRTPCPKIRNTFTWPAHCGDYAVFFRQVDADDLNSLAPSGDGKAFLASHLHSDCGAGGVLEQAWEDKLEGFLRFYLWQCPQCTEYLLTCDSD